MSYIRIVFKNQIICHTLIYELGSTYERTYKRLYVRFFAPEPYLKESQQ